MTCASDNAQAVDQSRFWADGSIHWDAHRVGWAIAGGCTALVRVCLTCSRQLIKMHGFILLAWPLDCDNLCYIRSSTLSVRRGLNTSDALRVHTYRSNYTKRAEQRQMYVPYPRP